MTNFLVGFAAGCWLALGIAMLIVRHNTEGDE